MPPQPLEDVRHLGVERRAEAALLQGAMVEGGGALCPALCPNLSLPPVGVRRGRRVSRLAEGRLARDGEGVAGHVAQPEGEMPLLAEEGPPDGPDWQQRPHLERQRG